MKVQEVILRAMAKKITWWQAAEILGISDRSMRRYRERYEEFGYDGLFDRRRGQPSPKRVPVSTVEQVLGLYRDRYFDLNVRHFHEKLSEEHQIQLSYTWVKAALQGAGLVKRGRKRGVHRKRRPRRPLPGMLLHIDGSTPPVVSGQPLARPDCHPRRCHQPDLLRAAGGAGIDGDGDGRTARGHRETRPVLRLVQRSRQPFLGDAQGRRSGGQTVSDAGRAGEMCLPGIGHVEECSFAKARLNRQPSPLLSPATNTTARGCCASPRSAGSSRPSQQRRMRGGIPLPGRRYWAEQARVGHLICLAPSAER